MQRVRTPSVCARLRKITDMLKSRSVQFLRQHDAAMGSAVCTASLIKSKIKPHRQARPDNQRNRRARRATRGSFPCLFFPQLFQTRSLHEKQVSGFWCVCVCVCHRARGGGRCCDGVTSHMRRHTRRGTPSSRATARLPLMRHAVFPNREILRRREQTFARRPRIAGYPASVRNDALARKVLSLFADTFRRKRARAGLDTHLD